MEPSDEYLYQRLQAGDEAALEPLLNRYHGPVLQFFTWQLGNQSSAEDVLQEMWTRIITWNGAPPQRFKAWMWKIATNLARDYLRSAAYRREHPHYEYANDAEYPPLHMQAEPTDEWLLRNDDRRSVQQALAQLSPNHREVVVLRFYQELKLEEIAEVVGVPLGTVKSRLFHALKQLKAVLEQHKGWVYDAMA
ncbi:RNA polymerase sigma factor [Herpetosiphon sp. NSE202]|uniref:RNA polymerase sigma factor n=1 Tax=Herpetosiphon sp. NSE202 TaxID=3351349 RepID=UPI003645A8B4